MKRTVTIIFTAMLLISSSNAIAGDRFKNFCKKVGRAVGDVVQCAAASYVAECGVQYGGMSREDANNTVLTLYSDLGLNTRSAERGIEWNNAQNVHELNNVISNVAFDIVEDNCENTALVKGLRDIASANFQYNSENLYAVTDEERLQAFNHRNEALANIIYDAYEQGSERRNAFLARKMGIKRQLMSQGVYNEDWAAEDVAGQIIAIQESKKLTEEEKEELLRKFGFSQSTYQIADYVVESRTVPEDFDNEVISLDEQHNIDEIANNVETIESIKQQEIQRKETISKIEAALLNDYMFDAVELSEVQMNELDKIAELLAQYPDLIITIIGHTCNIGTDKANEHVGMRRAENAQRYLVEKGIAKQRIKCVSRGKELPLNSNDTELQRRKNRRVEFVVEK